MSLVVLHINDSTSHSTEPLERRKCRQQTSDVHFTWGVRENRCRNLLGRNDCLLKCGRQVRRYSDNSDQPN